MKYMLLSTTKIHPITQADKLNRYLFSLGAVVAREYGLPCIVGVKNATKLFKTGDIVFLSGKTGELGKI